MLCYSESVDADTPSTLYPHQKALMLTPPQPCSIPTRKRWCWHPLHPAVSPAESVDADTPSTLYPHQKAGTCSNNSIYSIVFSVLQSQIG